MVGISSQKRWAVSIRRPLFGKINLYLAGPFPARFQREMGIRRMSTRQIVKMAFQNILDLFGC